MQIKILIIAATVIVMTIGTTDTDFCQSFKDNNYTVDYQYDHAMGTGVIYLLIIGHKYWQIVVYNNLETLDFELRIEEKGGESEWFGSEYRIGFTLWSERLKSYITGLVRKDEPFVDWGIFGNKSLKTANRSEIIRPKNMRYSFPMSISSRFETYVLFSDRIKSTNPFPIRTVMGKLIDENFEIIRNFDPLNKTNLEFDRDHELIGSIVVTAFQHKSFNTSAFISYIFSVEKSIKYCAIKKLFDPKQVTENCLKGLKTLIDCKNETITSGNSGSTRIISIVVIVLVALVFIAVGIYFMVCHRRRYEKPFGSNMSSMTSESLQVMSNPLKEHNL